VLLRATLPTMRARTLTITTADGHSLEADLAQPDDDISVGGVVVCHPHPLFGGNRFNPVVDAVFRRVADAGMTTIRFDFRGDHDNGDNERLDVVAALDALEDVPGPRVVVGYSFGALVAMATDDDRISAVAAIAPALTNDQRPPTKPVLIVTPRHDQFCPPETAALLASAWRDVTLDVIESTDHFLHGHTAIAAERVIAWLESRS
jgi:alpha/beta superfamily hydrolase